MKTTQLWWSSAAILVAILVAWLIWPKAPPSAEIVSSNTLESAYLHQNSAPQVVHNKLGEVVDTKDVETIWKGIILPATKNYQFVKIDAVDSIRPMARSGALVRDAYGRDYLAVLTAHRGPTGAVVTLGGLLESVWTLGPTGDRRMFTERWVAEGWLKGLRASRSTFAKTSVRGVVYPDGVYREFDDLESHLQGLVSKP